MAGKCVSLPQCVVCKKSVKNGVSCGDCKKSFHFNFSQFRVENCIEDDWRCSSCSSKREKSNTQKKDAVIERLKELDEEEGRVKKLTSENEELRKKLSIEKANVSVPNCRSDSFKNVLILGDSMVRHSGNECIRKGGRVECFPGIRAEQLCNKIERMGKERKERAVLLHVGTNNIKGARSSDHIVWEIRDLCKSASKKF